VQAFFRENATSERTRKAMAADGIDRELWSAFCTELGLSGVGLPEDHGGAGLGMVEFAIIAEAAGSQVSAIPLLGLATAARAIAAGGTDEQKAGANPDARIINTTSGAGLQGSIAQAAYSTAKGGIASLTLVQAAELGRYGITANALAPSARTRMTEQAFAEKMATEGQAFDVMDPANIAPTVVWLGSAESAHVTGCVFELEGGKIMIEDGWREGPMVDQQARWEPAQVGGVVEKLLAERIAPRKVWGTA